MDRFRGKTVAVVGAGSIGPGWGNGKASAVLYAREGARVIAADIRKDAAEETSSIIEDEGGNCTALAVDVTDEASVDAFFEALEASHGGLDVLHNNVGVAEMKPTTELSVNDWNRGTAINLRSVFLTCRRAIPMMKQRGGGVIVNTSSIADRRWVGVPLAAYAAGKAAVVQFTRSIALEHARDGIRANTVVPGFIDTPTIAASYHDTVSGEIDAMRAKRDAAVPVGHMGDAWDVARAAAFLASDEARYITGTELVVDGGLTCSMGFEP